MRIMYTIKNLFKQFWKFLRGWNEILMIPLAIFIFIYSPAVLRWLDPTAATYDAGILQALILAFAATIAAVGTAWLIFKLSFKENYKFLDNIFADLITGKKEGLTAWQKSILTVLLLVALLFVYVLSFIAVV